MDVKRIWKKEARKRAANEARKQRVHRNWPVHSQRALDVFTAFSLEAELDNVSVLVTEPEWFDRHKEATGWRLGEFPIGESSVSMRFGLQYTGQGMLKRTEENESTELQLEFGAELVVHYSPAQGVIQVFFQSPSIDSSTRKREALLYAHTYNTDDLTTDWLIGLLPQFLTFNRVESALEKPSWLDSLKVRWWRFRDIRNRRGYLEKFQHILTPWELVLLGAALALPGWAAIQWLWGLAQGSAAVPPILTPAHLSMPIQIQAYFAFLGLFA
jgi:hypothetical protein